MSDRRTAAATPSTASLVSAHVLVTGGCGSIGSRLVSLLVRLGARVRVVDSLNAYPFDYRREFAAGDPALAEVDLLVGDVQDEAIARRAVEGVTHIVHAAAFADVGASIREPNADFRANVVGTQQMLSAASASSIERFVFISSASVYGNPASNGAWPRFGEDDATRPVSTYANSKLWGEHQSRLFRELYEVPTVSLRIFSAYGPPQVPKEGSHSWCVAFFTMRALKGKPLEIHGDGRQVRDFVHVEDIARACVAALTATSIIGNVFNIGTGRATEVGAVANVIRERLGPIDVIHGRPKVGDPTGGYADVRRAREVLGWAPTIDLEDGIAGYADWVQGHPHLIPAWI